jgi:hypothetical protein
MFKGGHLSKSPIFDHILSIGYEFETSDMIKLSRRDDILYNLSTQSNDIHTLKQIDEHYFRQKRADTPDEYIRVPIEEQGKFKKQYNVVLDITSDISKPDFSEYLKTICKNKKVKKNNLYRYVASNESDMEFPIHFDKFLGNFCYNFSNVEFVVTYYHPQKSQNIIADTFFNACHLMTKHLSDLKLIHGEMQIANGESYTPLSIFAGNYLYHKPGTNMYYFHAEKNQELYDMLGIEDKDALQYIDIEPQMTMRVTTEYLIPVIKEMYSFSDDDTEKKERNKIEFEDILSVETCVDNLITIFNATHESHILSTDNRTVQQIRSYLFLILYKLKNYVGPFTSQKDENGNNIYKYFKDTLTISSRHGNLVLFKRIIYDFGILFPGETNVKTLFFDLISQPDIIRESVYEDYVGDSTDPFLSSPGKSKSPIKSKSPAMNTEITGGDELMRISPKKSPKLEIGNPTVSFISYFERLDNNEDWLVKNNVDTLSNFFDLPDDGSIFFEDRNFMQDIQIYISDMLKEYSFDELSTSVRNNPSLSEEDIETNEESHLSFFTEVGQLLIRKGVVDDLDSYVWNNRTKLYVKRSKVNTTHKRKTSAEKTLHSKSPLSRKRRRTSKEKTSK